MWETGKIGGRTMLRKSGGKEDQEKEVERKMMRECRKRGRKAAERRRPWWVGGWGGWRNYEWENQCKIDEEAGN